MTLAILLLLLSLYYLLARALRRRLARRRRAKRYIPLPLRRYVLLRDGGRCRACGSRDRIEFDHIRPVCRGGRSIARNLQCLCRACNRRKGRKW